MILWFPWMPFIIKYGKTIKLKQIYQIQKFYFIFSTYFFKALATPFRLWWLVIYVAWLFTIFEAFPIAILIPATLNIGISLNWSPIATVFFKGIFKCSARYHRPNPLFAFLCVNSIEGTPPVLKVTLFLFLICFSNTKPD